MNQDSPEIKRGGLEPVFQIIVFTNKLDVPIKLMISKLSKDRPISNLIFLQGDVRENLNLNRIKNVQELNRVDLYMGVN